MAESDELAPREARPAPIAALGEVAGDLLFRAERQRDGTYAITLTEDGLSTFETALGIARDLGGRSAVSTRSTIQDIMERTAVREELSRLLRRGGEGIAYTLHVGVLRQRLRGSEEPADYQRLLSHLGKALIVAIIAAWALMQFLAAIHDIAAIPGILSSIPNDILHLDLTTPIHRVGHRISDAGNRVVAGVIGAIVAFIVAKLVQPFAPIYRRDQLLPGERVTLRMADGVLRRMDSAAGDH